MRDDDSWTRRAAWIALSFLLSLGPAAAGDFSVDRRIESQRALEQVRRAGRIVPDDVLRARVERSLAIDRVLETRWGRAVTPERIQDEIERIVRDTRAPERLRELFAALEDDPWRIADSLARPMLAEREIRALYAYDREIHGALESRIRQTLGPEPSPDLLARIGGHYLELTVTPTPDALDSGAPLPADPTRSLVGPEEWQRLERLASGTVTPLVERAGAFEVETLLERSSDEIRLARVVWPKQPFDVWWRGVMEATEAVATTTHAPGPAVAFDYTVPPIPAGTCVDDTWTATSTGTNVPAPREFHSAVWTGSEMIVWGGRDPSPLGDGGNYEPATDNWTPTASIGAPSPRISHTAVWDGTTMIVWGGWGGVYESSGARYDPVLDSWTPTATGSGLPAGRYRHKAVWTGSEMLLWGGYSNAEGYMDTGGAYTPGSGVWSPTATTGEVPPGRTKHTAVWTGDAFIVWGGLDGVFELDSGGVYDPIADTWTATEDQVDVPSPRLDHVAVWTGDAMVVWGGAGFLVWDTGASYTPATDTWVSTPAGPSARRWHSGIWSDGEMIVWSGQGGGSTGGRFWPVQQSWTATSTSGAPTGRRHHTAVWIGPADPRMIVWGGYTTTHANSGGLYCALCPEATWHADADDDGFGDPGTTQQACSRPPGYTLDGSDCDDANPSAWAVPGPVRELRFTDKEAMTWQVPLEPGGTTPAYDTIRADTPTSFATAWTCVDSDNTGIGASDADVPGLSAVYYYLPRAGNGCGEGPVGADSEDVPRVAGACP